MAPPERTQGACGALTGTADGRGAHVVPQVADTRAHRAASAALAAAALEPAAPALPATAGAVAGARADRTGVGGRGDALLLLHRHVVVVAVGRHHRLLWRGRRLGRH